jgi:hypothetical protein
VEEEEEEEEEEESIFFFGVVPFAFVHSGAIGTLIMLCSSDCISMPDPG